MAEIKEQLLKIRNELYEDLPVEEMNAWDLIQRIKKHVDKLDELIKSFGFTNILKGQVALCIETVYMESRQVICFTKDKEYLAREDGMVWDDAGEKHWIDDSDGEVFLSKYFILKP